MSDQSYQPDSKPNTDNQPETSSRGDLIAMQPLRKKAGEGRREFAKRATNEFVEGLKRLKAKQGNLKMPRPPGV